MNKAEAAIVALNDAAEAYDNLPEPFKTPPKLFGALVNSEFLREEAKNIRIRFDELKEIYDET